MMFGLAEKTERPRSNAGPFLLKGSAMKTRLSVCARKARFATLADARRIAAAADVPLRAYRCDRCAAIHLTSRTKGKRVVRPCSA